MRVLCRRRSGFTLIELLVVIAVIAILAAILFPVFAQSREKARQATCQSNLKQLSYAIDMYKGDNDGKYPMARSSAEEAPLAKGELYANWSNLIYPYVKNGAEGIYERRKYSGVFRCPSDDMDRAQRKEPGEGPSYAVNGFFLAGADENIASHPSETVLIAEKRGVIPVEHFIWWKDPPWPTYPPAEGTPIAEREDAINISGWNMAEIGFVTPETEPMYQDQEAAGITTRRHNGGANWLYVDGHVKWSRLTQIWGNGTTTNQLWPTRK